MLPGAPLPGPEAKALADEAAEIRRLVDAGAGSPEAIRELAARLRASTAPGEEALWRAEIKPALVKEGKGRFRGHGKPATERREPRDAPSQNLWLGLGLLALVLVVIVAANSHGLGAAATGAGSCSSGRGIRGATTSGADGRPHSTGPSLAS